VLAAKVKKFGISLQTVFMAHTEPGRHWQHDPREWKFAYQFPRGIHPFIRGRQFHLNLGYLSHLATHPPEWLLISGSWYFPTAYLASRIARTKGVKVFFWNESNLEYVERTSSVANRWRSRVLGGYYGYVVPGAWAKDYIRHFVPEAKNFLQLPNVVDESLYRDQVSRLRSQRERLLEKWHIPATASPVFLCIARLDPIKGIQVMVPEFLSANKLQQASLVVAGDGPLAEGLHSIAANSAGGERVHFTGHVNGSDILELLAIADAFVLPSLGDPYPLAVIEAAFAGLPLLLSDKVGCYPEALVVYKNGLLFNPGQPGELSRKMEEFNELGKNSWQKMGEESLNIAEMKFETGKVIDCFVEALLAL
jgi:glycosyltransferase involved in cell wall biosynthesis